MRRWFERGSKRCLGAATVTTVMTLAGCGGGDDGGDGKKEDPIEIEAAAGCNPIAPISCAYPFPNMMLLAEDDATATGYRVDMTSAKLGLTEGPRPAEDILLELFNRADGFSAGFPILTQLGDVEVDRTLLPQFLSAETSLADDAVIKVFDMETGERLPFWAETDLRADSPERQSLMIRLQTVPLAGHSVAVAITDDLTTVGGDPIPPSEAYRALRDDVPTTSDVVEGMRDEYEALFTFLEDRGVPRGDTIQAWRFVVQSDDYARSQAEPLAQDAVAALDDDGLLNCDAGTDCESLLSYEITACETSDMAEATALGCTYRDDMHPTVWRRVSGEFVVPNFQDPDTEFVEFDGARAPALGTRRARFLMIVPASLKDAPAGTAPTMVFGHGLLALPEDYIDSPNDASGVQKAADQLGVVVIATRWTGLSSADESTAIQAIENFENFRVMGDRLRQSIANFNLLVPLVHGPLGDDPVLASAQGGSLIDQDHSVYYGISQGGIFGTTFMALSPHVRSGVLHVPTSMYSNVLQHSSEFADFQLFIDQTYPDPIDGQLVVAYTQLIFDPLEPANYARHLLSDPLTDLGVKNSLWQISWGDKAAPDFNAFSLGRAAGAPLVQPSTHNPFGFEGLQTPSAPDSSGVMIFDPGLGRLPLENDQSDGPKAHQAIRRNPEVIDQIEAFLAKGSEGTVDLFCGGEPCFVEPVPREGESSYP